MAVSTQQIEKSLKELIFQVERRLTASEYRVKTLRRVKKNHKEQIHLMDQRLVRAEAQILKNTDVLEALERAVN